MYPTNEVKLTLNRVLKIHGWRLLPAALLVLTLGIQRTSNAQPVLTVNRDTGGVAITNPGGTALSMDGYTIQSTSGSLSLMNWTSLEDNPGTAGAGWFEANPSANRLSELRPIGSSTLNAAGSWGLGNAFRPMPTQFGQNVEDLVFQFNNPTTQATVNGNVTYSGATNINNLVLFADPASGNVKIRNTSPFPVAIDGYTVMSASGLLNSNTALWTSLQDQPGAAGPNWFEANLSDTRVSELRSSGSTTLTANGGTTFDLGGLFKTGALPDLVFQFVVAGNSLPNTGVVLYQAAPPVGGVNGDYNNNGTVDAADYVLWRNGGPLQNDPTPGVQASDYDTWRASFGRVAGASAGGLLASTAVPEPATGVMSLCLLLMAALSRSASRAWR